MAELLTKEDRQYADYLKKHQRNVQVAFYEFINHTYIYDPIINLFKTNIDLNMLELRILHHDASKWSKEEFLPYRQYYYSANNLRSKELLNKAWAHHFSTNDHHPEYWIIDRDQHINLILNEQFDTLKSEDMSIEAIFEMLCDWIAMSLQFHSSLINWYNRSGTYFPFSKKTRLIVQKLIDILYDNLSFETRVLTYIPGSFNRV